LDQENCWSKENLERKRRAEGEGWSEKNVSALGRLYKEGLADNWRKRGKDM